MTSPVLAQFVQDIGAGSLSATVVVPADGAVKGPLEGLHDRVQDEIEAVMGETQALLAERWDEFALHVTGGRELVDRIEMEEEELDELEGDLAFLPALLASLSAHAALALAHTRSAHSTLALDALTAHAALIATLAARTSAGALPQAIAALDAVRARAPPPRWVSALPAEQALVRWAHDEHARLETAVLSALELAIEFAPGTEHSNPSLVLRKSVQAAPRGEHMDVPVLLQVLDEVLRRGDQGRTVDAHLARVARQLLRCFLVPYLTALGRPDTDTAAVPLSFTYAEDTDGSHTITLVPSPSSPPPSRRQPYVHLEAFLSFFALHSSLLPPSHYAATFTTHLTPSLQSLVLSAHVQPALPPTIATLEPYLDVLYAAAVFEEQFLLREGYFAFLPPGEEIIRDEGRVVRDWIALVDRHWARRVGDGAMESVREQIREAGWDGETVEVSVEIELPPRIPTPPPVVVEPKTAVPPPPPRAPPTPPPEPTLLPAKTTPARAGKLGTRIAKAVVPPPVPTPPAPRPPTKIPNSPTSSRGPPSAPAGPRSPTHIPSPVQRGTPVSPPSRSSAISPPPFPRLGTPILASRPSTPLSATFAPPPPDDDADDEADDPWGLSSSAPPSPIMPSPPRAPAPLLPAPTSLTVPHRKNLSVASIDVDDAWGLGADDLELESENLVPPPVEADAGSGGEDAWGFGDDEDKEVDPWGLDDEEAGVGLDREGLEDDYDLAERSPEQAAVVEMETQMAAVEPELEPEPEVPLSHPPQAPAPRSPEPVAPLAAPISLSPTSPSAGDNNAWSWDEEPASPPPAASTKRESIVARRIRLEKLTISTRSRSIVKIAHDVLVEALELAESGFRYPAFSPATTPLLTSFTSILALYRATAPVHHSSLLLSVPALGMQFANDAVWIGDEISKDWDTLAKGTKKAQIHAEDVHAGVERMRALGDEWRGKQVAIQRAALMECLDAANRFLYTSDDARFAACERALAQVTHSLERLAQVWKPVMNPTRFYSTLGLLVNDVLLRVLSEIEDQVDISEEESIRLNRLCKQLHGLESLFAGDNFSVGAEVPIWFKFVFLSEFLEASMADILFLFDHRHLVDFSIDEISRLVRALFADSPMRAKNLEHISRGHPETVATDSASGSDDEDGRGW